MPCTVRAPTPSCCPSILARSKPGSSTWYRPARSRFDKLVTDASPDDYDALLLPGGTVNPDQLRINPDAVAFVRAFAETGKPIAAICHGPWTLITAGVVHGRRLTSWPSLRDDLRNAGAEPVDEQVVIDGQFTTSRSPADLPAFCPAIVEQFAGSRVPS